MNWDRARNILIVAFLFLDIFLGYAAFGRGQMYNEVTRLEVTRALEQARQEGISVKVELPRGVLAAPLLTLKPSEADVKAVAAKLLKTTSPAVEQDASDLKVWSHDGARVVYVKSGAFLYTGQEHQAAPSQINEKQAQAKVDEFLTSRGLLPKDAKLDFVKLASPGNYVVQYYQEFKGQPVFGGYITAVVSSFGVDNLKYLWFNPIGLSTQKRVVIPATECLVKIAPVAATKLGRGAVLDSIKIGYLSEGIDARQWDAFPVWRFGFSSGYYVYVNGYTGEIERAEDLKE